MDYKLIIFDADGTLCTTRSGATFRKTADDWKLLPGVEQKIIELDKQGVKLAIATNQGGVAFGYMQPGDIRRELRALAEWLHIPYVAMCFSHPAATVMQFLEDSPRRKPGPEMLNEIIKSSGESKQDTLMVGDRPEDEQAARAAGVSFMWAEDFFR
jgi:D-glycero-D-manno-heptose 1,7-bisphosphate phosphatase